MMRVTRIDVAAETGSVAAIVRDGQQVKVWFYQPHEDGRPPSRVEDIRRAAIDDETAMQALAGWVQRGLEFTNGAPGRVDAYLVVIETLLEGD
jgi:hypothetical protein